MEVLRLPQDKFCELSLIIPWVITLGVQKDLKRLELRKFSEINAVYAV